MPTEKIEGIVQANLGPTHGFVVDDWGVWHFVHKNNVSKIGRYNWDDIKPGTRLRFTSAQQHGGKKGAQYIALEVEVVEP